MDVLECLLFWLKSTRSHGKQISPETKKFDCPRFEFAAVVRLHLQVKDHPTLEVHVISIRRLFGCRLPIFHFHAQLLRQVDAGITFERLDVLWHVIKASHPILWKEKREKLWAKWEQSRVNIFNWTNENKLPGVSDDCVDCLMCTKLLNQTSVSVIWFQWRRCTFLTMPKALQNFCRVNDCFSFSWWYLNSLTMQEWKIRNLDDWRMLVCP